MISIILPTYNSIDFLQERLESILSQIYSEWECIVIDGNSTDGTWESINRIAQQDSRFRMYRLPPKGVYNAWNKGVEMANGNYIYFATSDDTMAEDCLLKLKRALDSNKSCNIAHSCLEIIDANGNPSNSLNWDYFPPQIYFGELVKETHQRKAPLSGLLYFTHKTVIHSITQVLIRRTVFKEIGLFLENQGPQADLEWGMRTCLTENMVHVPENLATWRIHDKQLTQLRTNRSKSKHLIKLKKLAVKNSKLTIQQKEEICKKFDLWLYKDRIGYLKEFPIYKRMLMIDYWKCQIVKFSNQSLFKVKSDDQLFDAIFELTYKLLPQNFIVKQSTSK